MKSNDLALRVVRILCGDILLGGGFLLDNRHVLTCAHITNKIRGDCKIFAWNKIPGEDEGRLLKFLETKSSVDWAKNAKFEKIDNGYTIELSNNKKSLSLKLNNEITRVILKIDGSIKDEFVAQIENDETNIYNKINIKTFWPNNKEIFIAQDIISLHGESPEKDIAIIKLVYSFQNNVATF